MSQSRARQGGVQGPIGSPGVTGPQGFTGSIGPIGSPGVTGVIGPQGSPGNVGIGVTGPTGPMGPQGSGSQGPTGPIGSTGVAGPTGTIGSTGIQGPTGPMGFQGSPGPTGSIGPQGIQGLTGPVGSTGPMGLTGQQGLQGSPGVTGVTGPQGSPGIGVTGPMGPVGFTGVQGPIGTIGPTGSQGPIGFQGSPGPTGSIGPQGVTGVTGPTGPMGFQGSPGLTGSIGQTGPTGPAGKNSFNSTPTFVQNNATSVSVISGAYQGWEQLGQAVFVGTAGYFIVTGITGNNLILGNLASNLPSGTVIGSSNISPGGLPGIIGPTGSVGPQGSAGLQGATGPTGPQGATITGPTGPMGSTGVQGLQGVTGPQGAVGTQGIQGSAGFTGNQGPTGPQGQQGQQGLQGSAGSTGSIGPQGSQGFVGTQGIQGSPGITGVTGPMGSTGPQGQQGLQGSAGVTGSIGPQGIQGITGVTGPIGPTGLQGFVGTQGIQGSPGIIGVTGPQGAVGTQGIQGSTGPQGMTGPTGPMGSTGIQGLQGSTGPQGAVGTQGIQGSAGSTGPIGPQGFVGTQGIQGSPGITGVTGPQGATGPAGGSSTATINVYNNPSLIGQFNSLVFAGPGSSAISTGGAAYIWVGGGGGAGGINVNSTPSTISTGLGSFSSLNFIGNGVTTIATGSTANVIINRLGPKIVVWEPTESWADLSAKLSTTINPVTGLQEAIILVDNSSGGGSRNITAGTYDWTNIHWISNDSLGTSINLLDGFTFGSNTCVLRGDRVNFKLNCTTTSITTTSTPFIIIDLKNAKLTNQSGGNLPPFIIGQFASTDISFVESILDVTFAGSFGCMFRLAANAAVKIKFISSQITGLSNCRAFALDAGATLSFNNVGSDYIEGIGVLSTGVGTFINNVSFPTGMGVVAQRVYYDDSRFSPTLIPVGSAPTIQNAIDKLKVLVASAIGSTGAQGPQGIQGSPGVTGSQGVTGIQGPQGIQGLTGAMGVTGPQGSQGVTGPMGSTGVQGPQGVQGVTGPQGSAGLQGPVGPTGPAGSLTATINVYNNPSLIGQFNSLVFAGPGSSAISTGGAAYVWVGGGGGAGGINVNSTPSSVVTAMGNYATLNFIGGGVTAITTGTQANITISNIGPKVLVWEPTESWADLSAKLQTTKNPVTGLQEAIVIVTNSSGGGSRNITAGTYDWTNVSWQSSTVDSTASTINLLDGFTFGANTCALRAERINFELNCTTTSITTTSTPIVVIDIKNGKLTNLSGGNIPPFIIGQFALSDFTFFNSVIDVTFAGVHGCMFRLATNTVAKFRLLNTSLKGQSNCPIFALDAGAIADINNVGSDYVGGIGVLSTGVGTYMDNMGPPTGMGVVAQRVFYDDNRAVPTLIPVGSGPTVQNAIDMLKILVSSGSLGPTGPAGPIGPTGPSGGPTGPIGPQGSAGVNPGINYMQLGMTAIAGATFGPSGASVSFDNDLLKSGFLSHTTVGTQSQLVSFDQAGIYKISYNIVLTAVGSGLNVISYCQLNATGVQSHGTGIPQSVAVSAAGGPQFLGLAPGRTIAQADLAKDFILNAPSGVGMQIFVRTFNPGNNAQTGIYAGQIWATGSNLNIFQIT